MAKSSGLKRKPKITPVAQKKEGVKSKEFKWNVGQQRVIKALTTGLGKDINEILIAAGSRCFAPGTLVRTFDGYTPIEDIRAGDKVLSYNFDTSELEEQQVLKTFHNVAGHYRKKVIFVMRNGTEIKCTEEHEIYQKKKKIPAGAIARRIVERSGWHERSVSSEQYGPATDAELQVYGRDQGDEPSARCVRVSENYDPKRGQVQNGEDAPGCGSGMGREPAWVSRGESSEQYSGRQPSGEFDVGYQRSEQGLDDGSEQADEKFRNQERDESQNRLDRGESKGDSREIRSFGYEASPMGGALRHKRSSVIGRHLPEVVEARELNPDDVVKIIFYEDTEETYDICVAGNHNYMVSEDNLLVSNSGKTFLIVSILVMAALKYPGSRHLIARKFFSHVKNSIWADTLPKVLDILYKDVKPHLYWNNTDFYLLFPNGSEIWIAGLDDKERVDKILGREYMNIFFNEASEIDYDTYLTVKTRLAQLIEGGTNRVFVDENPPSSKHWTKVYFLDKVDPVKRTKLSEKKAARTIFLQIHPWENSENVSKDYLEMIESMPEAKRKRFYEGVFRDDAQFALWRTDTINKNRVTEQSVPPLKRIVVAVDPAVTNKDTSDETGIVVRGLGFNGHLYTLADYTGKYTPTEWAVKALDAYAYWHADSIVAEVNNGGDLVETVIRLQEGGKYVSYEGVHATRNKLTRAEPVAALTEQGLDHHVGEFPDLEEEQTTWEAKQGQPSPNRIDAFVWGTFALIPEMAGFIPRMGGNFVGAMRMTGF